MIAGRRWRLCRRVSIASTLPHVTGVFNLVAFLAIAMVTTVLIIGIQESANLNTAIVIVKLGVVGIFLVLGIGFILKHPDAGTCELDAVYSAERRAR